MINYYESGELDDFLTKTYNPNFNLHNIKIPSKILFTGASGGGKTNALLHLLKLFCSKKGTFDTIQIYCKAKDEPIYEYIVEKSKGKIKVCDDLSKLLEININDFDKNQNHLIVFDDLLMEKYKIIPELFIRCRKKNLSCFYLSQSYHQTNIILRKNTNYFVFCKLTPRDVKAILKEMSLTVEKKVLMNMYHYATREKMNVFLIDNDCPDDDRKYRKNFLEYLDPKDFM